MPRRARVGTDGILNTHAPDLDVARHVVADLNLAHGLRFTVRGRCDGGLQSGAWLVSDPDGRRGVLKCSPNGSAPHVRQLAAAVQAIRTAGYPTPAWRAAGVTATGYAYHVQDVVDGAASTPLTPEKATLLIDVLERQAGLGPYPDAHRDPDPARDWSRQVLATAADDGPGGCRRALHDLGAPGQALLGHFDRLVASYGPVDLPRGDLVHGDFNSCNIVLHEGRVSGVIDIETLGNGTRAVDYACLLREAYVEDYGREVTRLVLRAGDAVAGRGVLAVCAAAAAFFIVPFKLRHEPERIDEVLSRLHDLATDLADAPTEPAGRR